MKTKIIEATSNEFNWGKFMLCRFTPDEVAVRSAVDGRSVVRARGWDPDRHLWVLDLQTGEGACFSPKGHAAADLQKHRVWVCPLFEPFLSWLYTQDLTDLDALPALVDLPNAENAMFGYRRKGPEECSTPTSKAGSETGSSPKPSARTTARKRTTNAK